MPCLRGKDINGAVTILILFPAATGRDLGAVVGDGAKGDGSLGPGLVDRLLALDVARSADVVLVAAVAAAGALPSSPESLGGEEGLEGGRGSADDGDVDLEDGPEVDENALLERIDGKCVGVDSVEANDRGDGREGTDTKNEDERNLLLPGPVDLDEGLDGKRDDPDIGDDVKARSEVEESSGIDTRSINGTSQVPHFVNGSALASGDTNANNEEDDVEGDGAVGEEARVTRSKEPEIHAQDGDLDGADRTVVGKLNGERNLDQVKHVVNGERFHSVADVVGLADKNLSEVAKAERHGDKHEVVIPTALANKNEASYRAEGHDDESNGSEEGGRNDQAILTLLIGLRHGDCVW